MNEYTPLYAEFVWYSLVLLTGFAIEESKFLGLSDVFWLSTFLQPEQNFPEYLGTVLWITALSPFIRQLFLGPFSCDQRELHFSQNECFSFRWRYEPIQTLKAWVAELDYVVHSSVRFPLQTLQLELIRSHDIHVVSSHVPKNCKSSRWNRFCIHRSYHNFKLIF